MAETVPRTSDMTLKGGNLCSRCGISSGDVQMRGCGCILHARCTPLTDGVPLKNCPCCRRDITVIRLLPVSFSEIDEARRTVAAMKCSDRRGRKRKESSGTESTTLGSECFDQESNLGIFPELRTGRWTAEETMYCYELIVKFQQGELPLKEGTRLNDFLANILKSKQSRLTKKMKNAKLSTKAFNRTTAYIADLAEAQKFSRLEESLFHSIICQRERAETRFHVQKEWKELFSSFCMVIGQPLDAVDWLSSVKEMDRRESLVRDAARLARRKLMMGPCHNEDNKKPQSNMFTQNNVACAVSISASNHDGLNDNAAADALSLLSDSAVAASMSTSECLLEKKNKSSNQPKSCFVAKVIADVQQENFPFEHIDCWVPSFGSGTEEGGQQKCHLCYAGSGSTDTEIILGDTTIPKKLSEQTKFNLNAFAKHSENFSFGVGCDLAGRVYQSGVPTWEQSIQYSPMEHFARNSAAAQWGIKTAVGIPISSPNVGRIVVVLYSCHDRSKDQGLVGKLCNMFENYLPVPKWKLVVDLGSPQITGTKPAQVASQSVDGHSIKASSVTSEGHAEERGARIDELLSLLAEFMPTDKSSPLAAFVPGFISLRHALLRASRSKEEEDIISTIMGSYVSYKVSGRSKLDIATMMAREFMLITQYRQQNLALPTKQSTNPTASSVAPPPVHFNGDPPSDFIYKNSPALTPIVPSKNLNNDDVSVVSH